MCNWNVIQEYYKVYQTGLTAKKLLPLIKERIDFLWGHSRPKNVSFK